jgi:hypothetical protein
MANLDPASNPGSKPQRFSVKNCKSSTSDKLQIFKPIFGISCKFLAKNSIQMITCYEVQQLKLLVELSAREIIQPFRKIKARINDLRLNGMY